MEAYQNFNPSLEQALRTVREVSQQRGETNWTRYGDSIDRYDAYFSPILHGQSIVDMLSEKEAPIVLDLMAPSETIVDLFGRLPQPQKYGIALSYEDLRSVDQKERDKELHIQQLQGDITEVTTWKTLEKSLKGKKADLIMERAMGGISCLPVHKSFYVYAVAKMWDMLSPEEGTLLVQIPTIEKLESVDVFIPEWVEDLRGNGIEAESYSLASLLNGDVLDKLPLLKELPSCNALKLIKRPDSPVTLPIPHLEQHTAIFENHHQ